MTTKHEVTRTSRLQFTSVRTQVGFVKDRATPKSAMEEAGLIADDMRNHGVLISTDGPLDIVLKIKSPVTLGFREAGILSDALNTALSRS